MKKNKIQIYTLLALLISAFALASCDTDTEALEVQKLKTYDEQYYKNLRDYKKSDHCLSFGWYAAYAPIEGVEGYKDPASWGERIIGLPDSLDICSLWMGIPSDDPNSDGYAPIAYADMKFVQEKKGTRFVSPTIMKLANRKFSLNGQDYDFSDVSQRNKEGIEAFAQYLVNEVLDAGIDGIDLDFEPEGDWIGSTENFMILVKHIAKYFGPGPDAMYPDKLLCIDFYGQAPPRETEPYVNYYIRQSYGASSASTLQSQYNTISWAPSHKFIVTETFGDYYENGGVAFTEADGNTVTTKGSTMYSLEGMARWNPTQGRKAGFGAFYFDRDYYSKTGIPYYNMRRCIQIANPAIH